MTFIDINTENLMEIMQEGIDVINDMKAKLPYQYPDSEHVNMVIGKLEGAIKAIEILSK